MKYSVFRNPMHRIVLSVVLATGAMAPGMGIAASSSSLPQAALAPATVPADATKLFTELSQANRYEIQVGRLAEQRAVDANVRAFASALVRHRLSANLQLRLWAKARGVDVAEVEAIEVREENLSGLRGREFDKQFVQSIGIDETRAVIDRLSGLSESAPDADLRAWASRTLSQVKRQLTAAEKLQGRHSLALN